MCAIWLRGDLHGKDRRGEVEIVDNEKVRIEDEHLVGNRLQQSSLDGAIGGIRGGGSLSSIQDDGNLKRIVASAH